MTEPTNLTTRLNALRDQLTGGPRPNSLSDVHSAVSAILGPEGAQVSLNTLLMQLTRDGLADLKTLADALSAARDATEALRGVNNATLSALLTEAQFDSWGVLANGLLADIKSCVCETRTLMRSLVYGALYDETNEEDASSTGIAAIEGRKYAVWGAIPDGLTSPSPTELSAPVWDGWQMLIQTTDPAPRINGETVPPGVWVALTGTGARNASVALQYPITAYVRRPVEAEYTEFVSELLYGAQRIRWPNVAPFTTIVDQASVLGQPLIGYKMRFVSLVGTVSLLWGNAGQVPLYTWSVVNPGTEIILDRGDGAYWTYAADGPFVVRMYVPE